VRDSYYSGATRFIVDNREVDSHLNQLGYGHDTVCKSNKGYDVKNAYLINRNQVCVAQAGGKLRRQHPSQ